MSREGEGPAQILRALERRARRRFGQNFLANPATAQRIADLLRAGPSDRVLEIGPGLGQLSRALLATGAAVRAVELDRDLADYLEGALPELELLRGDALSVDLGALAPGRGWLVCANLPYNVATPLVHRLLDEGPRFARLVLMFQKEVARRLTASRGSKAFGALTVRAAARADAQLALILPPGAFHPRPKVDSGVVIFTPHPQPRFGPAGREGFDRAVKAGFSQRRKTLENALKSHYGREVARAACAEVGVSGRRAETLDLGEWRALAAALARRAGSQ